MSNSKATGWMPLITMVMVALIILAAAFGGFVILVNLPDWLRSSSQTIVILLVAGLVSVALLLYLGTMIMKTAGLTTKKEALGMPEGSIRALIAMSLILMFAIIGVTILYSGMGGEPIQSNGITSAELEQLENVQVIAISVVDPAASPGTERFNVTARPELSPAGHDFGLQLLTTVSTLVVAVAGFYFGSRAVAQGAKTAAAAQTAAAAATSAGAAAGAEVGSATATIAEGDVAPLEEDDLVGAVEDISDDDGEGGAEDVVELEVDDGGGGPAVDAAEPGEKPADKPDDKPAISLATSPSQSPDRGAPRVGAPSTWTNSHPQNVGPTPNPVWRVSVATGRAR